MARDTYVGGQAVIEGVMMRGLNSWAVAVRKPDGNIEVRLESHTSFGQRHKWAAKPFIRGAISLGESLVLGMRALTWSAEKGMPVEPEAAPAEVDGKSDRAGASGKSEQTQPAEQTHKLTDRSNVVDFEIQTGEGPEAGNPNLSRGAIALSMSLAVVFFIGVFILTPTLLTKFFVDRFVHQSVLANLAEGAIRLGIFIGYIALISLMPDIRRVFEYHGAEHKTIAAYEYGDRLVPEAVARYSTRHVRCGTSFLLIVMVLAIIVYSFLGRPPLAWRLISRVVLIPVIAGISYEIIRLAARNITSRTVRIFMAPGLALQGLTTREPSLEQLEVAVESLRAVLPESEWREVIERPILEEAVAIPA